MASGATLDVAGLTGGGLITKTGAGTILADTPNPTFLGGMTINGGTVRVTAIDGDNASGLGHGTVTIGSGGTLTIEGVDVGLTTTQAAPLIQMDNGSTLIASGTSSYNRSSAALTIINGTSAAPKTVDIKTVNASDVFTIGNAPKQSTSGGETYSTIRVSGPGRVVLTSGGTTSTSTFAGSWELDNGILQIGPVPAARVRRTAQRAGLQERRRLSGQRHHGQRRRLRGRRQRPQPDPKPEPGSPVVHPQPGDARRRGDRVDDAGRQFRRPADDDRRQDVQGTRVRPGRLAGACNVNLVASADTSWAGTLVVDPGTTTGGAFNVNRDGGTVTVAAGAQVHVLAGATLNLAGRRTRSMTRRRGTPSRWQTTGRST